MVHGVVASDAKPDKRVDQDLVPINGGDPWMISQLPLERPEISLPTDEFSMDN